LSSNPYERGDRKVVPAVLVYAFREGSSDSESHRDVLMIYKSAGPRGESKDGHAGKYNGLGGKMEADESPTQAARREFQEEAGLCLPIERFQSLGVIQFPHFKPHKHEDWWAFTFRVELSAQEVSEVTMESAEGTLHWVGVDAVLTLPLWAADQQFLPMILEGSPFTATFWYENGKVLRDEIVQWGAKA